MNVVVPGPRLIRSCYNRRDNAVSANIGNKLTIQAHLETFNTTKPISF